MDISDLTPFFWLYFFFILFMLLMNHPSLTTADETVDFTDLSPPQSPPPMAVSRTTPFRPGIVIIVGVIATIFSITFLVLLYVKHFKRSIWYNPNSRGNSLTKSHSGVNKTVIEKLPLFRFASLRGQKDGLECSVCLNRFESEEVLRLLPKCKHAFHVECVDTWLDKHSTCPLCRYRVDPKDILSRHNNSRALYNYKYSGQLTPRSIQGSRRHSSVGERGNPLEIIVETPKDNSRRKSGNSTRSISSNTLFASREEMSASRRDGQLAVQGDKHRLDHCIVISDGGEAEEEGQRRWSEVEAVDILYLKSEMILGGGAEEEESGRGVINDRSVSEITGMSRYKSENGGERKEEGVLKRWLDLIPGSKRSQDVNSKTSSSSIYV